ncbi:hypothetical protein Tco_0724264, partial [Tanacetum coccineum]
TIWIDKYKLRVFKAEDRKDKDEKVDGSKGENGRNGGDGHRSYQRQGVDERRNKRDERLYSDVVRKYNIKKGFHQYEMNSEQDGFKQQEEVTMNKSERVIEVEPDEHVFNIMERIIIGKVKKMEYLEKIHSFIQMEGMENVLVKYVGGLDIMLVFENSKTVYNIMMNIDHGIRQWLENHGGVRRKIAMRWGTIMETENCSLKGNQNVVIGRVMVHTMEIGLIQEFVQIKKGTKRWIPVSSRMPEEPLA